MRYLDRVRQDLRDCVLEGVLTADQALRTADCIARRHEAGAIKGTTWIAVFAGLSVAAGVSLIIAHNWDTIPALAKVGGFLLALLGVGSAAIGLQSRGRAIAIPLELLWQFLPLLGIGLYAQVYQLSGDPVRPFLVWLLLTLPLAWLSPHPVAAPTHLAGLVATLLWGTLSRNATLSLLVDSGQPPASSWLAAAILLALTVAEAQRLLPPSRRSYAWGALLAWALCLMGCDTPFGMHYVGILAPAALAAANLWLVASSRLGEDSARRAPAASWLLIVYLMTFLWHEGSFDPGELRPLGWVLFAALSLGGVSAPLALRGGLFSGDPIWERRASWLLAGTLLCSWSLVGGQLWVAWMVAAAANLVLVLAGIGLMWHGSLVASRAQINGGVGILLLILVTRFIDIFGSMLEGGVAFISAGACLALLAWGLDRGRRRMLELAGRTP